MSSGIVCVEKTVRFPTQKGAHEKSDGLTNHRKSFILETQRALALQTASSLPD